MRPGRASGDQARPEHGAPSRPALLTTGWESALSASRPRRIALGVVATLVIMASLWPYIFTFGTVSPNPGDSDYFFQAYEAVRKTILTYHQFPWWNPWVGGGVPLFANPQVGVFSIQTVLVLIFGTVYGLKLSVVVYMVLGFWGAVVLFRRSFHASRVLAGALAYCWVFDGFFISHLFDHYTFSLFAIFPWLLYLQLEIRRPRYWIFHGVALAAVALSAAHYAFFQSLLILAMVGIIQLAFVAANRTAPWWGLLARLGGSFLVMAALAGIRIFYSAQYVLEFPRSIGDPPNSLPTVLAGLFLPVNSHLFFGGLLLTHRGYNQVEYVGDVGLFVGVAAVALILYGAAGRLASLCRGRGLALDRRALSYAGLIAAVALGLLLAAGNFGRWAPYRLLQKLPVFSGTRVPSRWLIWAAFAVLVALAYGITVVSRRRVRLTLSALVVLAAIELFILGFGSESAAFGRQPLVFRPPGAPFQQYDSYDPYNLPAALDQPVAPRPGFDRRYVSFEFEATLNNLGDIRGYEPISDTRFDPRGRCGINDGCSLVLSGNASVVTWSPNEILLHRTAPGSVVLDMAPSRYTVVNDVRVYPTANATGPGTTILTSSDDWLRLTIQPPSIIATVQRFLVGHGKR